MSASQKSGRVFRSNYDRLSRWYDLLAAGSEHNAQAAALALLGVDEGDRVLEIGSGTGRNLLALARCVGVSGMAIGIDLSRGMIAEAKAKLGKSALTQRAALVYGDAVRLPFQAGFCDAIFVSFTLELFPPAGMARVLSECWRVLRAGGSLCVVALAEKANPARMARFYGWAHRKFPEWIDCRPIDAGMILSGAGFQIRKSAKMHMWGLPVAIVLAEKSFQAVD